MSYEKVFPVFIASSVEPMFIICVGSQWISRAPELSKVIVWAKPNCRIILGNSFSRMELTTIESNRSRFVARAADCSSKSSLSEKRPSRPNILFPISINKLKGLARCRAKPFNLQTIKQQLQQVMGLARELTLSLIIPPKLQFLNLGGFLFHRRWRGARLYVVTGASQKTP